MTINTLAFLGAGSMAEAIVSGLLSKNLLTPEQIRMTNRDDEEKLQQMQKRYRVKTTKNKKEAVTMADTVILAMKPKDVTAALTETGRYFRPDQLVISVLAGVSTDYIASFLPAETPIVRAMPNTSAAVGESATAIAAGKKAREKHLKQTETLFQAIGATVIVDEKDMHAVTGLSGSGPAYIYYLVEALEKAALSAGLDASVAKQLIVQTVTGAAEMLKRSGQTPEKLRQNITSPGGTTEAGLKVLQQYHYEEALIRCVERARARSIELGQSYSTKTETASRL